MKCAFSGKEIEPGTGLMFVKNDGTVLHFANRKSMMNFLKLRRNPRKVKWTEKFEKGGKK